MALTKVYTSGNNYIINAQCVDAMVQSSFDEYVDKGVFSYVWGKKLGFGDINWYTPSENSSLICEVPEGVNVTVFLKIRANTGDESEAVSIIAQKINYSFFNHDPSSIRVTQRGVFYNYQHVLFFTPATGGCVPITNGLYYIWRNNDIPSTFVPDSIRIGQQVFPLLQTIPVSDGVNSFLLYKFNIGQSTIIQKQINQIQSPHGPIRPLSPITIEILCDDVVEQTILLHVTTL